MGKWSWTRGDYHCCVERLLYPTKFGRWRWHVTNLHTGEGEGGIVKYAGQAYGEIVRIVRPKDNGHG